VRHVGLQLYGSFHVMERRRMSPGEPQPDAVETVTLGVRWIVPGRRLELDAGPVEVVVEVQSLHGEVHVRCRQGRIERQRLLAQLDCATEVLLEGGQHAAPRRHRVEVREASDRRRKRGVQRQ
jgi:hypothetical protein